MTNRTKFSFLLSAISTLCLLSLVQWKRVSGLLDSFIFPGSDNDGTYWWLINRCRAPISEVFPSEIDKVAYPHGYDISPVPFWNLFDQLRIFGLKLMGCDPIGGVAFINLIHIGVLVATAIAVHLLIYKLVRSNFSAVIATQIFLLLGFIDNSRMQTSLSVVFFSVFSLALFIDCLREKNTRSMWFSALLLAIQTLVNAYWGIFTLGVMLLLLVFFPIEQNENSRMKIKSFSLFLMSVFLGLFPLLPNQFNLYRNKVDLELVRPLNLERNYFEPHHLFTRPFGFLGTFNLSEFESGPRLTFLPLGLVLLIAVGIWVHSWAVDLHSILWRRLILISILISCAYFSYPGVSDVTSYVYQKLSFIRALSLLQFFFQLFLVSAIALTLSKFLKRTTDRRASKFKGVMILILAFCSLLEGTYSQFNQTPTFSSTKAISPWIELGKLVSDGPIAHYPDIHDEFSDLNYGLPNRIIEFAQIGHDKPVMNGQDVREFKSGCGKLPRLDSRDGLAVLIDSGARTIVIHRRFIEINELNVMLDILMESKELTYIGNVKDFSKESQTIDTDTAISLSLDADVFQVIDQESPGKTGDCRFENKTRATTSVNGATHGLEINGEGRFWWHNGDNSTVAVMVRLDGPVFDKRVYLRFIPNPCYTETSLRFNYSDSLGKERETFVYISKDEVSMPIFGDYTNWWRPILVEVDFPKTSCSLKSDPRNLGVGIREAVLE